MTKTIAQIEKDFDEKFYRLYNHQFGSDIQPQVKSFISKAITDILKSVVPEGLNELYDDDPFIKGFNDCRETIIKRISLLTNKTEDL